MDPTLLVLADGRFPAGGHAHSGGLEAAVVAGLVTDLDSLAGFLRGRLATAGLVAAAFAAAACRGASTVDELETALDARTPSPAQRLASRRQGRAMARAGCTIWPGPELDALSRRPGGPHHAVALGLVAAAAGLGPTDAALAAAYGAVTGPASAAVRLLGLDPYRVHRLVADLAGACGTVATRAAADATGPVEALPSAGAPLLDISAEVHAGWEVRLFAS